MTDAREARYAEAVWGKANANAVVAAVMAVADEELAESRALLDAADAAAERRLDKSIEWMERAEAAEAREAALRDALSRIEVLAKAQAVSCQAAHRADHARNWLDVLAIIERSPAVDATPEPTPAAIAAQALRDAALESYQRGDIGKPDGGVEAWVWLRGRADQIEAGR